MFRMQQTHLRLTEVYLQNLIQDSRKHYVKASIPLAEFIVLRNLHKVHKEND
jgi:hypothetical protein